jgi:hypothetical protein
MPSKHELIERIREFNRSVNVRWLERFEPQALVDYAEHLQLLVEPRGRDSVWRRRGDTAAVVGME